MPVDRFRHVLCVGSDRVRAVNNKMTDVSYTSGFAHSRAGGSCVGCGSRLCENAADAQFPGSSNPSRNADRRSWADLEGRLWERPREDRVFTQPRWPGLVAESLTHACVPPPPNVKFRGTADSRPRGWPTSGIGSRRHSPATFDRPLPVSSSPLADCPERPLAPKAVRCGPCTRAQPADPERYRQQMLRSHAAGLTPRSSE
jgi:hypothetical protein